MKLGGVNRIVVAVRDLEKSKRFYSEVLGATFYEANWTGEEFGIEVAISWDAGIELCAPMPGREHDSMISPVLDENGEGIVNVVFGVSDADQAKKQAESAGVESFHCVDFTQKEIDEHLDGLFKCYKEFFLNSYEQCGFGIALGQIDQK
jgi:catechol 2,3-dioxygenase-like lactoylglutathione lyase family enzyme